ncbi:MAG: hypothetical protein JWP97_3162 [Labilithrix sp.]|nr:hypothetical protein [Labilithrix sp.]
MLRRLGLWTSLFSSLLALGVAGSGCAQADDDRAGSGEDELRRKAKLQLVVTVDWEGRDLRDANLRAMEDLRARFPQVKIVHFLNAAYYAKKGADAAAVTAQIGRVLLPGDEKGLHIHGWKRLFEASDVTFRGSPTFWGTSIDETSAECTSSDCGHEVPISLYDTAELREVVHFSLDTLEANGFGRPTSFRCGGWIAKDNVRDAIAAEGVRYDHSSVPPTFLAPKLKGLPLLAWLSDLWKDTTELSQPAVLATATSSIVEVPDNGALADYVTADQMVETFEANEEAFRKEPTKSRVVSIGFHQETAATYLPAVEEALTRIYAEAEAGSLPLESVTSAGISVARSR